MKFVHIGGGDEDRWRWFDFPGSTFKVELRLVTTGELAAAAKKNVNGSLPDYVAAHWFRGFENATDAKREPIPNTVEMRRAMLEDQDVWAFVQEKLASSKAWHDEGNADSGTA